MADCAKGPLCLQWCYNYEVAQQIGNPLICISPLIAINWEPYVSYFFPVLVPTLYNIQLCCKAKKITNNIWSVWNMGILVSAIIPKEGLDDWV